MVILGGRLKDPPGHQLNASGACEDRQGWLGGQIGDHTIGEFDRTRIGCG